MASPSPSSVEVLRVVAYAFGNKKNPNSAVDMARLSSVSTGVYNAAKVTSARDSMKRNIVIQQKTYKYVLEWCVHIDQLLTELKHSIETQDVKSNKKAFATFEKNFVKKQDSIIKLLTDMSHLLETNLQATNVGDKQGFRSKSAFMIKKFNENTAKLKKAINDCDAGLFKAYPSHMTTCVNTYIPNARLFLNQIIEFLAMMHQNYIEYNALMSKESK